MVLIVAPRRVLPLTDRLLTALMLPPMLASPLTVRLLPAPARVLPEVVLMFEPARAVSAPSVMAPV